MTTSFVVNGAESPVSIGNPNMLLRDKIVQNAAQATGNGTEFDITGIQCIVVSVSGTFVGGLVPRMKFTGESFSDVPAYDINTGLKYATIEKPGTYYVLNTTGKNLMCIRLGSYTSGSVTVHVCGADPNMIISSLPHQVEIGSLLGRTIAASASASIAEVDITGFAFVYCMVRTDETHNFRAFVNFKSSTNTLGNTVGDLNLIDGNNFRAVSDWAEVKGVKASAGIVNNSGDSHVYDFYFYGVR